MDYTFFLYLISFCFVVHGNLFAVRDVSKQLIKVDDHMMNVDERVKQLSKQIDDLNKQMNLVKDQINRGITLSSEVRMAEIFNDSVKDINWLVSKNFCPSGDAANYSFLYILFRILNECNPTSVIEFGIGQTSKMTSQYAAYKNKDSKLVLVENDQVWIDIFKNQIAQGPNIYFLKLPVESRIFKECETTVYKDLLPNLGDMKFDLIVCDGPRGCPRYSRIGVLDLIPNYLKESFVVIIDDYHRIGERDTAREVMARLDAHNIKYGRSIYRGNRAQLIIYSENLRFLKSL